MAYDEGLAQRIREVLEGERGITEKAMFGGLAFLRGGKMFVGITGDELLARIGPEQNDAALTRAHVRPMDFTGKPMKGYVYVAPEGVGADAALAEWVRAAITFVATLGDAPKAKPAKKAAAKKGAVPTKEAAVKGARRRAR